MDLLTGLFVFEGLIWLCAAVLALLIFAVKPVNRLIQRGEVTLRRIARKPAHCFLGIFLAGLLFRICLLPIYPIPTPSAHDEYSYLFAADTFHALRLTNPTPPVPIAFESFHVNVVPTYQSMYQPGGGLVLALGQFLGHPWFGILLSTALMCAVIYWALAAWLPPGWALLGGCMAVFQYCGFSWWMNMYFVPGPTAIGGALLLGLLPRIARKPRWSYFLLFGVGASLLFLTRPYEGFVFALPLSIALLISLYKRKNNLLRIAVLLAPAATVLGLAILWLGYYNWRGTGSALVMPYQLNWKMYHIVPALILQRPQPIPHYHHALMRQFYIDWELPRYLGLSTRNGLWLFTQEKLFTYLHFFLQFTIFAFVLGFLKAVKSRHQILAITALLMGAGLWLEAWRPIPHYAAPATALILLLMLQGYRWARSWKFRRFRAGLFFTRALAVILLALGVNNFIGDALAEFTIYPEAEPQYFMRARIESQLSGIAGKQLVLVRYAPTHNYQWEWVYNRADLRTASVVWARSIDTETDEKLIKSFPDRRVWVVEPDRMWMNLSPYHLRDADRILADSNAAHAQETGMSAKH